MLRVAGVIGRASPDVIGLNEVDRNAQRSGNIDIATELGKLTGLHATFAKAIPLGGGSYGNAVLSKEKPLCVKRFPLPGSEPRVLLFCEFEDYWFGTMHLALKLPEQKKSMEIVKREIANLKTEKPIFLSGDWNCRPKSAPLDQIREDMTIISKENGCTFTNFKKDASETEPCIDYIAVNKKHADDITVKDAYIVSDAITSDHNPVVVVLEMPIKTSGGNAGPVQR